MRGKPGWIFASRQCFARWIPDRQTMLAQVGAGEQERSEALAPVDWRFRLEHARFKLKPLFKSIQ